MNEITNERIDELKFRIDELEACLRTCMNYFEWRSNEMPAWVHDDILIPLKKLLEK